MDNDLLARSLRAVELLLLLCLAIGLLTLQTGFAVAMAVGGGWWILNVRLIKRLAPWVLLRGRRWSMSIAVLLLAKFPLLYLLGWFLVARSGFSPAGLIVGFSLPFFVLTGIALLESRKQTASVQKREA